MNRFDVFIIVLVTVIFLDFLVVHLHHDHLVTTFELSNTLNNIF